MAYQILNQPTAMTLPFDAPSMSDLAEAKRFAEAFPEMIGIGEETYDADGQDALRVFGPPTD